MKKSLTLILFFAALFCKGQNLVPNPSFEDTVSCPTTANQIDKAIGWHASRESPDYFNECDFITGNTAVPGNFCGYQYANTGKAYAGFIAYTRTTSNGREYFTSQLLSPLIVGKKYLISYYLSWAGSLGREVACNKTGFLFSTNNFTLSNPPFINNYCQVYSDSLIYDSLNWVLIEGSFISDSSYNYLTIGNFFDDVNTDTMNLAVSSHAYYYIDDISVVQDTLTAIEEVICYPKIIYPNPASTILNIDIYKEKILSIDIFTVDGKSVFENLPTILNQNKISLNITALNKGIYFIKLNLKSNNFVYHKFLKL